jgi:hypothetical protein
MVEFPRFNPPLDGKILPDVLMDPALLLDHSLELEVIGIDDLAMNAGELPSVN